jgi:hypothetical protein
VLAGCGVKLSVAMAQRIGRNEACLCGSGRKYKRCCLDSNRRQGHGEGRTSSASDRRAELTLLVETPRGVMERRVPSASPLRSDLRHGDAAEAATHDAAAVWGLPDFVYLPEIRRVGSGTRELGDGFIIVGDLTARAPQPRRREAQPARTPRAGTLLRFANARQLPHVECGASSLPYDGQRNSLSGPSPARKDEFGAADLKE